MNSQQNIPPIWVVTNGWREIFARVFENTESQFNVVPEWLINPATNRRLKLDLLYPEINVAVRFEGLQGKNRRKRLSLEEESQLTARQQARIEMCQSHGVYLIVVHLMLENPKEIFNHIDLTLSRAGHQAKVPALAKKLKDCRTIASSLARKIDKISDLKLYADLWEDRQYQIPDPTPAAAIQSVAYAKGMEVEHTIFGPGVVLETISSDDDMLITVDFVTAGQKTLAASLVSDKLLPS